MNLYHIKLTDNQKSALEHLFSLDIEWNKSELEKAWNELRVQVREAAQHVAIINALQDSGCNCNRKTPTKYDPNRKFRKGDKVRVKREVHGRPVYIGEDAWEPLDPNEIWEVVEEKETGWVHLKNGCLSADVWHGMLELVTSVEELEPYYVSTNIDCSTCTIFKKVGEKKLVHSDYYFVHGKGCSNAILGITEAQAAAEAERDRLNAEYRNEQE